MERKRTFYDLIKIMITIIVAGILTYHNGNRSLFNINKFQTIEYTSLQSFEIINAKLLNKNTICSITDDSQIILTDLNKDIQNVSITIDNTSLQNFVIQVFYDTGKGFNEVEASSQWGRSGVNLLQLNCRSKIHRLRIDPTTLANHQLVIGKITLNQQPSSKSLSLILIFNVAFLLFITLFYTREECRAYKITAFIFYTAVLYISDNFWLINAPGVYNILFFIVLCLILIVVPLIWKEIKKSAKEEPQK